MVARGAVAQSQADGVGLRAFDERRIVHRFDACAEIQNQPAVVGRGGGFGGKDRCRGQRKMECRGEQGFPDHGVLRNDWRQSGQFQEIRPDLGQVPAPTSPR